VATSTQTARDQEAIPILLKELEAAQVLKNAGDTRAAGDVDAIVRELALKGVKVDAIPAPAVAPAASAAVQPQPVVVRPTLGEQLIGAGETALTLLTGVTGGTVGTIAGTGTGLAQQILSGQFGTPEAVRAVERAAVEGAQALTYQPRTQAGQEQVQAVGQVLSNVLPPVLPIIAAPGQLMQAARQAAPITQATAQRSAQAVQQATARGVQSITGRAPARPPAAERPEPRLFAADALAAPTPAPAPAPATAVRGSAGAAATPEAVRRVTTAEGLRVPVTLTRGAAQRDAAQLAFEKEQMKGEFGAPLRDRVEENNLQILQNFDATIDATGAKAAFSGPSATGGSVVNALSAGWQAAKNKTRVAYTKAKNSPEAQAEVDTNLVVTIGKDELEITDSLIGYINSQITGLPSSVVPDTARKLLTKMGLADIDDAGNLIAKPATVGKLEEFRKELSGTAKFDDDVALRQETILKKLVDAQTDPVSGPLYKEARALRTKQANKYEDRAIVARLIKNRAGMKDPQVAVDKVFQRSILNGSPEEITFLKRVLLTSGKDGQQAFKELQAATVQHIRDQATSGVGTDSAGRRLVSPAKLNEIVSELDKNGRLDVIFGKQEAGRIRDLDEVVKYVTTVPPGTLINSSGTVGTLLAALAETGAVGVTTGLPVPVISGINQIIKWRKAGQTKAKINDALNALPIVKP
jgi:hypothetical protein